jgi:CubicO group peptidase (beta-lactamase class C family)
MAQEATAVCTQHLVAIGRALDAYQRDKGDKGELPHHLSDLHPKYLPDKEILHCPADTSPGSPGYGFEDDPRLPTSYFYAMSTDLSWDPGPPQLGPDHPGQKLTWRERRMSQRIYFGNRVPMVSCAHHKGRYLHLTPTGQVYHSRESWDWEFQSATVSVMLDWMGQDLVEAPKLFTAKWVLRALEEHSSNWIDSPLPPSLRCRLGVLAERLFTSTKELAPLAQGDAYRVAARFYRAAGLPDRAIAAARAALDLSGDDPTTAFLSADLRYEANGKRGAPPVDAYLKAEIARLHIPSLAVAVVRDGKTHVKRSYGLADVEASIPGTADTVYDLGSMTKQFTAAAVLMLVEEGKVRLDNPIPQYLPDLPSAWSSVHVRHLLTHTSGVKDYFTARSSPPPLWQEYTPEQIMKLVSDLPLAFLPGEGFAYSNTGYILLGTIIERITGKPYGRFLAERIFKPLQMTATLCNDGQQIIENRATGYMWQDGRLQRVDSMSPTLLYSAGAIVSTVSDLAKWDSALCTERLLKRASLQQMWSAPQLGTGESTQYGFGWEVSHYRGRRLVAHSGGVPGFQTRIARHIDDKLTVIMLCNRSLWQLIAPLVTRVAGFYLPPAKPIEDKQPKLTRRLKTVLLHLAAGEIDPEPFTSEAYATLAPKLQQASTFYQSLGSLKFFRLIEQTNDDKNRMYRYRARYGDTKWIHTFVLTEEGKIAEVGAEPE